VKILGVSTMNQNKCKNCKFYREDDARKDFGGCACSKLHLNVDYMRNDELCYSAFEISIAKKIVGKNFGCVHHERDM